MAESAAGATDLSSRRGRLGMARSRGGWQWWGLAALMSRAQIWLLETDLIEPASPPPAGRKPLGVTCARMTRSRQSPAGPDRLGLAEYLASAWRTRPQS